MTLRELKETIDIPAHGMKTPTARKLKEDGRVAAEKYLGKDAWIIAYQEGYALYYVHGRSTVFLIHGCRDYLYTSDGANNSLAEQFFQDEPWYVRLVLEGEDRLEHNQNVKEYGRSVPYSGAVEGWQVIGTDPVLECLVSRENVEKILGCPTKRQRAVVCLCFLQQKTRKEVAKELGIK